MLQDQTHESFLNTGSDIVYSNTDRVDKMNLYEQSKIDENQTVLLNADLNSEIVVNNCLPVNNLCCGVENNFVDSIVSRTSMSNHTAVSNGLLEHVVHDQSAERSYTRQASD
jgi:hypothetical protein